MNSGRINELDSVRFDRRMTVLAGGLIGLAAFAVYFNSFAGVFLLDDRARIEENPNVRNFSLSRLFDPIEPEVHGGRPVVTLTLGLNYAYGKSRVRGYHAVNLAIHILAAWTLFGVIRRTLSLPLLRARFGSAATPLALAAALIWTVHPLQTGAVTYIIQRSESLMALFYLLTLYCVIRGAGAGAVESGEWRVERDGPGARGQGLGGTRRNRRRHFRLAPDGAVVANLKPQASSL